MNEEQKCGNVINIGVAGSIDTDTGQRTSTLVEQMSSIKAMNVIAFYNKEIGVAKSILKEAGLLKKFECVYKEKGNRYPCDNKKIFTDDPDIFLSTEKMDIVVVTEINAELASEVIYRSLEKSKKVINMNAVSEATLGYIFKKLAESNKVIYSVGAGDEPAVVLDLINFCNNLGLDVICAGKGKNNPLNIYCTPDDFIDKGKEINVNPRMISSFVDGTKTMLEMAILSNASGIPIDITGMHGPEVNVSGLVKTFNLKEKGGILKNIPVIDYGIGDIAPGVFVVFTSKQKSIINELQYLKLGNGPNFVLFKPYHLGNIESPLSVYDVALKKKPTLTVKEKFITMVVGRAKRDLKEGDLIGDTGGSGFSGLAINFNEMIKKGYAPIGLIENSRVKKNIKKDEIILFENIACNTDSWIYKLWNLQKLS